MKVLTTNSLDLLDGTMGGVPCTYVIITQKINLPAGETMQEIILTAEDFEKMVDVYHARKSAALAVANVLNDFKNKDN